MFAREDTACSVQKRWSDVAFKPCCCDKNSGRAMQANQKLFERTQVGDQIVGFRITPQAKEAHLVTGHNLAGFAYKVP
ncbi:hypothetical protein GCM10008066_12610 [Oxalicibacterium faecigallinarum]|uniref:Uncharacterized protein n=1 Tax=Oxalicibacterium faecigallinarum TaxID=573741 RepID=A0A8J3AQG6_9BURK|nr:hypothetical protein GCM10008066_12610 [Oxalicibacterium faecigallinarum]